MLSGRDAIVPSHHVNAYLLERARPPPPKVRWGEPLQTAQRGPRVEVEMHERWHHGWLMLPCSTRARWRLIGR